MQREKSVEMVDFALWIERRVLVFGDTHIGYEEALNKQGVLVPRFQQKELLERLKKILEKTKPEIVVINGDLKHEFGRISDQEWRETLQLLDLCLGNAKKLILIKGNHDTILGPIAKKREIEMRDYYCYKDVFITHGHTLFSNADFKKAKMIIIGNEHPVVSIRDKIRVELYKCFLVGTYKRKKLIVMPSACLVTEGSDILKEEVLSPYLQQDLSSFEVYVLADKIYPFGRLRNLKYHG